MKKHLLIGTLLFAILNPAMGQTSEAANENNRTLLVGTKECTLDTLEYRTVGPGTTYFSLYLKEIPIYVYILKLDLQNPYNNVETFLANDKMGGTELVSKACERSTYEAHHAYCGINGDFFNVTDHREFPLGAPRSASAKDGVMQRQPRDAWWSIASIDKNKVPFIDHAEFEGEVTAGQNGSYKFYDVNIPRAFDPNREMTFFNRYAGPVTRPDENYGNLVGVDRTEVYLTLAPGETWQINQPVRCIVGQTIENTGGNAIAPHESVLSAIGGARAFLQKLKAGDEVTIQMKVRSVTYNTYPEIYQMVGGNAVLMRAGEQTSRNESEAYNAMAYPRTIIASSADKRWLYLFVADGKTSVSKGLKTAEACDILKYYGANDAVGLDGGGSSEMIVSNRVANKPSDGKERSVGNGWLVIDTSVESNEIDRLEFWNYKFEMPCYTILRPMVMGFNRYGKMLSEDLQNVQLSCSSDIGYIDGDGNFIVTGPATSGYIKAKYGNVEVTKPVSVVQSSDFSVRLDSVLLDDKSTYPIEVYTNIKGKNVLMDPNAFQWTIADNNVCRVNKGVLSALANGSSQIVGKLNNFEGSLKVNVEMTNAPLLPVVDFNDETFQVVSNIKGIKKTVGESLNVHYDYTSTRAPYLQLSKKINLYSKPSKIRFVFNPHNIPVNSLMISFSLNNKTAAITNEYSSLQPNADNVIEISTDDLMAESNDIAVWPISFNSFKMMVNASGHTVGAGYDLDLKEFSAIYDTNASGVENDVISHSKNIGVLYDRTNCYLQLNLESPEVVKYAIYSISGVKLVECSLGVCMNGNYRLHTEGIKDEVCVLKIDHGHETSIFKLVTNK